MKSRRTFLKILAGIGTFIVPWTVLPELWREKSGFFLTRPSVKPVISPSVKHTGFRKPSAEILARKAIEDIEALSHPDMQGRRAGTAGETKALVYLEEQLGLLNLEAFGDNGYWQMFSIPSMKEKIINGRALFRPDETDSLRMPAANILAGLPGKNQEEAIIISSHYDHLGIYNGKLCSGANDNASGVGCILQVMRRLVRDYCQGIRPQLNIVAAFWGAEEMGYLGSKHFVKNSAIPLSNLKALINYDTVGNGEKKDFILWSAGNSPLIENMKEAIARNGATLDPDSGHGHQSDEAAFSGTGIPAVTMLSKDWLINNHTPEDNISLINEAKLETACSILYDVVKEIAY
jgi:aminopeptidase YwaD